MRGGFLLDWKRIKAEYIAGGTSYRKLAEKHNVPFSTLKRIAKQEEWTQTRTQVEHKVDTEIVNSVSEKEAKNAVDIIDVADKLLEKIEEVAGMISDPDSIKKLTSAIKDIKDIKGIKSEADMREQEARIEKLRREAERDEGKKEMPDFVITGLPEEFKR
jgi:hypothetical protein